MENSSNNPELHEDRGLAVPSSEPKDLTLRQHATAWALTLVLIGLQGECDGNANNETVESHADFSNLSADKLEAEILDSKKILEKKLGVKIEYFAYPKGAYNQAVIDTVKKAGYKMAFTMDDSQIITTTDKLKIPRVGVDKTHKNNFENIYSVGSVIFRQAVKASPLKGAIL